MNYEVDPNKSQEYRRFLFNFNQSEVMDGDGTIDNLHLAYFPSPAINPRRRRSSSVSSIGSALGMTPSRRGSTSGKAPSKSSFANLSMTSSAAPEEQSNEGVQRSKSLSLEKNGQRQGEQAKNQPPPQGKRLRCKMCRYVITLHFVPEAFLTVKQSRACSQRACRQSRARRRPRRIRTSPSRHGAIPTRPSKEARRSPKEAARTCSSPICVHQRR